MDEFLTGGNVNEILLRGDAVHRSTSGNPHIHRLLRHLETIGFEGVPRFLGTDEAGREVLSFLPGETPGSAYPECAPHVWSEESLTAAAGFLRRLHDATAVLAAAARSEGWTAPPEFTGRWTAPPEFSERSTASLVRKTPETTSAPRGCDTHIMPDDPAFAEVICHNDAAPYNFIFRAGLPVGLIDFDMACPGPRLWDLSYSLYTFVPLSSFEPATRFGSDTPPAEGGFTTSSREVCITVPYDSGQHAATRRRRIRLFLDAYGIERPADLSDWVVARISALCDTLAFGAAAGNAAYGRMIEEGHLAHYEAEIRFLRAHSDDWT